MFYVPPLPASAASTVVIRDIAFTPRTLTVRAGARVTWSHQDPYTTHNVRSRGALRFPGSKDMRPGDTYSVRLRKAGTYRYVCTLHPGMTGRVVVKPAR